MSNPKKRGRPKSKKPPKSDRHLDPRFTFHLEAELMAALDAYCESFPHHGMNRAQVVRDVLRDFLRAKGHFPRPKEGA